MNAYDEKINNLKETWQPPSEIKPVYLGYAFLYELVRMLNTHGVCLFNPSHLQELAKSCGIDRNNYSIDLLKDLPTLLDKYGVYEIREFVDHFMLVGIAFDICFKIMEGPQLYDVVISNKYDTFATFVDYDNMESFDSQELNMVSCVSTSNLQDTFYCTEWLKSEEIE